MQEEVPNLVASGLSRVVTKDGVTVEVCIYRLEGQADWTLEVVNKVGTSTVWDDVFPSDDAAMQEFHRTVAEEGMRAFLDSGKILPFRR